MAAESAGEAGRALDREWVDRAVVDWEGGGGQYRELIVPARTWLEWVVRRGGEGEAVRAAGVLLAAGGDLTGSTSRALAARFPQADGRRS